MPWFLPKTHSKSIGTKRKLRLPPGNYTIVISCAANAYGDYMTGYSKACLYVDDFEWVY